MKERFELVYYIVFMILLTGGVTAGVLAEIGNGSISNYFGFIAIGFLMTLARYIYNGQHFWNPPFDKPSNWKIILFVIASSFIMMIIEDFIF